MNQDDDIKKNLELFGVALEEFKLPTLGEGGQAQHGPINLPTEGELKAPAHHDFQGQIPDITQALEQASVYICPVCKDPRCSISRQANMMAHNGVPHVQIMDWLSTVT